MTERPSSGTAGAQPNTNTMKDSTAPAVDQQRLVRPHGFIALRGYAEPDCEYRSRFNFVWWFWIPRIHTQRADTMNPRVIRVIWLCFAAGLDIWGKESRMYWPNAKLSYPDQALNSWVNVDREEKRS